ncbi:Uncharacterised protein [Helicobacter pametensis]|nr:Uncharacterised protein [Helicobacter pametensis]
MPFTLAHPVAMLPFARHRRVHFPAMVIGSLAPDFVYFLHGRAVPGGHGLANLLWPNLPLCFAIYALYLALWHHTLRNFLPNCPNAAYRLPENTIAAAPQKRRQMAAVLFAFMGSALFGMATHLFLDTFTHPTGWFVQHFAPLQQLVLALPAYKWLQYGGAVCSAWAAACCLRSIPPAVGRTVQPKPRSRKASSWAGCTLLTLSGWALWQTAGPCRYANNPPHRLRRAQIITALHGALLSGIANALLFSYCVGLPCCTFVLSAAHGLVGEDVASAIA